MEWHCVINGVESWSGVEEWSRSVESGPVEIQCASISPKNGNPKID